VGEDRGSKADGAVVSDDHIFRMQLVYIDKLGDPYILPDLYSPHLEQEWPQAATPGANHGDFMNNPIE